MTMEQALTTAAAFFDGMHAASVMMAVRTLDAEGADDDLRAQVLEAMDTWYAERREAHLEYLRAEIESFERACEPPKMH
jgi:hypothetical protein